MKLLIVLAMLAARAASVQDLSGKMLTFPLQTNQARVRLVTPKQEFRALTVCHRSFTDIKRDHGLFSLSTSGSFNSFLIFWDETNKEMEAHVRDQGSEFRGLDYKPNMWHSICTTWDSVTGLVQLWFNGRPTIRKYVPVTSAITGSTIIILGQEQDAHGGGFDSKQAFVGMMSDVHMWDYVLSSCEIQSYVDELNFTPGNVLNWKALEFEITDKVLVQPKSSVCH
ncbi:serum amyloid P-component-like [Salarias fasciatus]|uniref:serum amyloid P-component-like n=1 Tax=Salarias fasciatus TaxID=181472 RepID=UPI0011767A7B|nr:serum amyloid P-component-like [Salarias fasciatus]